ncbi:alpha/beta hydrolase [Nocardia sp. alder85J]|uniref:alpha/beta hydrolase n=1 Tax=Nocardia sp. alder85J TaxID=2862949 RepID=UPI001CD7FB68|nr:alpha/beta hydrolase family protein [Nocardia sp. alder85J]MCX4091694.1 alpha/beta hydrolase family protein [Nocardia sp. alder85J]
MDRRIIGLLVLLFTAVAVLPAVPAAAEPGVPPSPHAVAAALIAAARPADDGTRATAAEPGADRFIDVTVHSAAMDSDITVKVLRAHDTWAPAPTLYLLNGSSGGDGDNNGGWTDQTDMVGFFADKQVNVVVPIGGRGSYFTDWRADDPVLGRPLWTTFLTEELPPVIDSALHTTGVAAIAGVSMSGTSVFQLAMAAPGLYKAIGSYSGCVETSDPTGQAMVSAVVGSWSGNPVNMWGPPGDPAWAANDPYLHADRLRGTAIYVSSGTGWPGPLDTLYGPGIGGDGIKLIGQLLGGALLETVTDTCTQGLRARFAALQIPATFQMRPSGTHSWGYWQQDLHDSWPMFADALATDPA